MRHGLDANNANHIWLLHYIFLGVINAELSFFADSWNHHRIQIRHGPNRSPIDMFGFDMLIHGVRGIMQNEPEMTEAELEVYGIDWRGLQDEQVLQSQAANNSSDEGWSSWIGRIGPPAHLSDIPVESPEGFLSPQELMSLNAILEPLQASSAHDDLVTMWTAGLVFLNTIRIPLFSR